MGVLDFGEDCRPWEIDFPLAGAGVDADIIVRWCEMLTDNGCARAACIVESEFVMWAGEALIRNEEIGTTDIRVLTDEYYHDTGFDFKECSAQNGMHGQVEKACCGREYPARFPYKINTRQCNDDGDIVPFGL